MFIYLWEKKSFLIFLRNTHRHPSNPNWQNNTEFNIPKESTLQQHQYQNPKSCTLRTCLAFCSAHCARKVNPRCFIPNCRRTPLLRTQLQASNKACVYLYTKRKVSLPTWIVFSQLFHYCLHPVSSTDSTNQLTGSAFCSWHFHSKTVHLATKTHCPLYVATCIPILRVKHCNFIPASNKKHTHMQIRTKN
jgi:hypothetical protein